MIRSVMLFLLLLLSLPAHAFQTLYAGEPVPRTSQVWRHTVLLISNTGSQCSGVIVSSEWLLTAAHCAAYGLKEVVFFVGSNQEYARLPVLKAVPHRNYFSGRPSGQDYDLALVKFSSLPSNHFFAPLLAHRAPSVGDAITLAGFGQNGPGGDRSKGLHEAKTKLLSQNRANYFFYLTEAGTGGACQGDSGGPAFNAKGELVGIITRKMGNLGCDAPAESVFIELGYFRSWVNQTLRQ